MKKILFLLAIVGIASFASCDKEPVQEEPEEEPDQFPIGTWQTVHRYYRCEVRDALPPSALESIKESVEQELSVDVSEADAYLLTFNKQGTGFVSPGSTTTSNGYFTWQDNEGSLTLDGTLESIVFPLYKPVAHFDIWHIEESGPNRMVLSLIYYSDADGTMAAWGETHTYRYTFERVE